MLGTRFDDLWEELTARFVAYHEMERSAATVVGLATARAELDDVRWAISVETRRLRTERALWPRHTPWRTSTRPTPLTKKVDADHDDLVINAVRGAIVSA